MVCTNNNLECYTCVPLKIGTLLKIDYNWATKSKSLLVTLKFSFTKGKNSTTN